MTGLTPDDLRDIDLPLSASSLSDEEKEFVRQSLWDAAEFGEIKTQAQYDAFCRAAQQIEEQAIAAGIPIRSLAKADQETQARWIAWTRTPEGRLLTTLDAARLAWEDRSL